VSLNECYHLAWQLCIILRSTSGGCVTNMTSRRSWICRETMLSYHCSLAGYRLRPQFLCMLCARPMCPWTTGVPARSVPRSMSDLWQTIPITDPQRLVWYLLRASSQPVARCSRFGHICTVRRSVWFFPMCFPRCSMWLLLVTHRMRLCFRLLCMPQLFRRRTWTLGCGRSFCFRGNGAHCNRKDQIRSYDYIINGGTKTRNITRKLNQKTDRTDTKLNVSNIIKHKSTMQSDRIIMWPIFASKFRYVSVTCGSQNACYTKQGRQMHIQFYCIDRIQHNTKLSSTVGMGNAHCTPQNLPQHVLRTLQCNRKPTLKSHLKCTVLKLATVVCRIQHVGSKNAQNDNMVTRQFANEPICGRTSHRLREVNWQTGRHAD